MATSASQILTLVDTSVAVPIVLADHANHVATTEALEGRNLGLAGHAGFETFSILTRLPPPNRRKPPVVARVLAATFPESRFLGAKTAKDLLERLAPMGLSGGSIYDALVGAVAAEQELTLATRDRRAMPTYRALGIKIELID